MLRMGRGRRGVSLALKGKYRDLCGDKNVVLFDHINVSILIVPLYYSFSICYSCGIMAFLYHVLQLHVNLSQNKESNIIKATHVSLNV